MIDHLSASQITVYLDCSLKYRYSYIDRLPKPFRASGLALGSAIHAAVEWFHNIWAAGQEVDLESVCDIFEADWYAQTLEPIRYKKGENSEGMLDLGRNLLRAYYEHAPHSKATPATRRPNTFLPNTRAAWPIVRFRQAADTRVAR